jgi:hypothetical protein
MLKLKNLLYDQVVNVPLVEGISDPTISTAIFKALAKALKADSAL